MELAGQLSKLSSDLKELLAADRAVA